MVGTFLPPKCISQAIKRLPDKIINSQQVRPSFEIDGLAVTTTLQAIIAWPSMGNEE
jgi:hypothetical protein